MQNNNKVSDLFDAAVNSYFPFQNIWNSSEMIIKRKECFYKNRNVKITKYSLNGKKEKIEVDISPSISEESDLPVELKLLIEKEIGQSFIIEKKKETIVEENHISTPCASPSDNEDTDKEQIDQEEIDKSKNEEDTVIDNTPVEGRSTVGGKKLPNKVSEDFEIRESKEGYSQHCLGWIFKARFSNGKTEKLNYTFTSPSNGKYCSIKSAYANMDSSEGKKILAKFVERCIYRYQIKRGKKVKKVTQLRNYNKH